MHDLDLSGRRYSLCADSFIWGDDVMATIAPTAQLVARERRFFFYTAIAMATVIVAGFSLNLAMARSSFSLPLIYHVHAMVFMAWVGFYVFQNALVATGSVALHRRLGWVAVAWLPLMVVLATVITVHALRDHGGPPFFAAAEFLIGNPMGILFFAGVSAAGIVLRRQADWHRRLMFCGMAAITGPGFGRLLPIPLMIPYAWVAAALIAPSVFPLIGMIADRRRSGRIHPAWLWGWGAFVVSFAVAELVAFSPAGESLTRAVLAGSPGATRPMLAYMP